MDSPAGESNLADRRLQRRSAAGYGRAVVQGLRVWCAGAAAFLTACAAASAAPTVTELTGGVTPGFSANSAPFEIAAARDGRLWFTEATDPGRVARVNADGSVSEFPLSGAPWGLAEGLDRNIWVAESADPGLIARVTPAGAVTELVGGITPGFSADVVPRGVAVGPDGHAWFTEAEGGVARVNDDLSVSELLLPGATPGFSADARPAEITIGPDGRLWFTDDSAPGRVSRINDDLSVTEFAGGAGGFTGAGPFGITAGPDGAIWVTGLGAPGRLARTIGDGTFTELTGGITAGFTANGEPLGITAGADRQIWFAAAADPGRLGRVSADGSVTELAGGLTPGFSANGGPSGIVTGHDGDIWFTEQGDPGRIGRLTPGPGASTGEAGAQATSAHVLGSVRPHGHAAVSQFEYGTTAAYGAQTALTDAGSGTTTKLAQATISGLAPSTLYHYRLRAANDSDVTVGADRTFTTAPALAPSSPPVLAALNAISRLKISPSRFRAAPKGASVQAAATTRPRYGARVSFNLLRATSVRFTVVWLAPGRQPSEHGACVKPTRRNRKARACTRPVVLHGGFTRAGRQGANALRFSGRLASHKLAPGRYELFATPSLSGRLRSVHFGIVK
jgi:streptogramin lyase